MSAILLVDDHPVMRALLRHVLEAYPDIVIVAEAEDGEEAVSWLRDSNLMWRLLIFTCQD